MPPSVGFRIGGTGKSRVKYLVVQVHYATKLAPGERDYAGLDLEITSEPQKYIGGILLMVGSPEIPPHTAGNEKKNEFPGLIINYLIILD